MDKRAEVLDARCRSSVENTSYYQKCIFQGGGHAEISQGTLCLDGKVFRRSCQKCRPEAGHSVVRSLFVSYLRSLRQRLLNIESIRGVAGNLSAMQNLGNMYRPTLFNFINYF